MTFTWVQLLEFNEDGICKKIERVSEGEREMTRWTGKRGRNEAAKGEMEERKKEKD